MLTIIGLGSNSDRQWADALYHRIDKIAFYDAVLFASATVIFVLHCVPVYESDELPNWWYPSIYYGVLVSTSLLAGGAVSIVAPLYFAVKDIIQVVRLGKTDNVHAPNTEITSDVKDRSD